MTALEETRIALARQLLSKRGLKEMTPEEAVEAALRHRNPAVAFSGGKSSLVVLHMAWIRKPDVKVVFNNTKVEVPGTVEYVRRLAKEWRLDLIETEPIKPDPSSPEPAFWQCWRLFGPPAVRGSVFARADTAAKRKNAQHPQCCVYLKELPALRAYKEHFVDAVIRGLQVGESRMRMFTIAQNGQRHWNIKLKVWTYDPIAFWTDGQVWEYIRRNRLPYNPAYDKGFKRTGCLPCTAHRDWPEKLAKTYPKMRDFLLRKIGSDEKGNAVLLRWLQERSAQEILPCSSRA